VTIVVFADDLMDRSRISAALGDVTYARDPATAAGADVVVVDLARHAGAVAEVRASSPATRIVAFGPHVDTELLDCATADGADVVVPRSRFFQDPAAATRG
jgi:hypothetical protein